MQIQVNGETREVPDSATVSDLLAALKLDPRFLAVECNRELVPRTKHHAHLLQQGDQVEIVTLVGGG